MEIFPKEILYPKRSEDITNLTKLQAISTARLVHLTYLLLLLCQNAIANLT
ncbi:MAG: hypothetical protein RMX63_11025 [Aulosira sp. ZfuCHP01]|nr:hypothetical protein [Aulosira sp. ZfuVER01]MDZ7999240.1 hypothetical protein [Aulosira sp. DedVER01a]MDZ8051979.1 hypothetical protein [Aulosira sp. ZfuCHP01]